MPLTNDPFRDFLRVLKGAERLEHFDLFVATKRIRDVAELLRVELADHVVVGEAGKYFSFRESELL
ncbi:MAG: JAB domain-containing protein [Verrucomicrobiales bacterium]|nr:JAB domain-containing protein [Verrucomicrobiales bacterium]